MHTQNTPTTVEIRANVFWPDEANLAAFAEQDVRAEQDNRAEKNDRAEQTDCSLENHAEYAALYFVS